jgi:pimeloyl-ACP methyl ester carboxylesterase
VSEPQFASVPGGRLEYREFEPSRATRSGKIVMLHEGLGSVGMWKRFPFELAAATGMPVVAYSRFGYGRSDSPPGRYGPLEMQEKEATEVLPAFLEALHIEKPVLFGHSDGASISLIYAGAFPENVEGVVALAPHVFVEDMCITSIEGARQAYLTTDLPRRLALYHRDPDRAFWGWNDIWLDPAFRAWNIEHFLPSIACPVLGIQGYEDEYGTMEQLDRLAKGTARCTLLELEKCGHSPHRDQPERVLRETTSWLKTELAPEATT